MRLLLLLLALAAPLSAAAQQPEWRGAVEHDVLLRPFDIEPETIRLPADRPVKLRFVNQGQSTLSFSARDFFRAARLRQADAEWIGDGHFRLAPGERRTVAFIPARGRYHVRSGNLVHRILGMTATIIVE